MLDTFVDDFVAEYNLMRHLAKYGGNLLYDRGEDTGSRPAAFWQGHPCYRVYFTCNNRGFMRRFGSGRDFSEEEIKKYNFGRFIVAVDREQIQAANKARITDNNFPKERIVLLQFTEKNAPKKAADRNEPHRDVIQCRFWLRS